MERFIDKVVVFSLAYFKIVFYVNIVVFMYNQI